MSNNDLALKIVEIQQQLEQIKKWQTEIVSLIADNLVKDVERKNNENSFDSKVTLDTATAKKQIASEWLNIYVTKDREKQNRAEAICFSVPNNPGLRVWLPKNRVAVSKSGLSYKLSFKKYELSKIYQYDSQLKMSKLFGEWPATKVFDFFKQEWTNKIEIWKQHK